jgi:hypothetical protein
MAQLNKENCLTVLSSAGPVLRYRTAAEILNEYREVDDLRSEVLKSDYVKQWLWALKPRYDRNMHGSTSDSYENVMGKLYDFGLKKGVRELDKRVEPYLDILDGKKHLNDKQYMGKLYESMIAGFLAMTGFWDNEGVNRVLTERLDWIYDYVKKGDLSDFYVSQDSFKSVPNAFQDKKLVNPLYYGEKGLALPLIYDILGFIHSESMMKSNSEKKKINEIIELIFSTEYQNLPQGYGIVWKPPRKYYAMGWSIHVPLFNNREVRWGDFSRLLLYLGLFKRLELARSKLWFKKSLEFLSKYIDPEGVPLFPSKALPEKKTGMWVLGARMGLEPGRRIRKLLVRESAFRYLLYTN